MNAFRRKWESSRLAFWWSLPWRCKFRHAREFKAPDYGSDYGGWFACRRCNNWLGGADET